MYTGTLAFVDDRILALPVLSELQEIGQTRVGTSGSRFKHLAVPRTQNVWSEGSGRTDRVGELKNAGATYGRHFSSLHSY